MSDLYSRHSATLAKAVEACEQRYSWTAYPESPGSDFAPYARAAANQIALFINFCPSIWMSGDYLVNKAPKLIGKVATTLLPIPTEPWSWNCGL